MKKAEILSQLRASTSDYVTYGDSDLGMPIPRDEAIHDFEQMDEEMIGEGTWYECDETGKVSE